jgi:hypothetical protein
MPDEKNFFDAERNTIIAKATNIAFCEILENRSQSKASETMVKNNLYHTLTEVSSLSDFFRTDITGYTTVCKSALESNIKVFFGLMPLVTVGSMQCIK